MIVGRCADFVLKDREDVVSVFVHAPMDYCIARGMERNDMDEKEMEKFIQKTDKYRGTIITTIQVMSGMMPETMTSASTVVNWGFDKCVEAIKGYINVRFGG